MKWEGVIEGEIQLREECLALVAAALDERYKYVTYADYDKHGRIINFQTRERTGRDIEEVKRDVIEWIVQYALVEGFNITMRERGEEE